MENSAINDELWVAHENSLETGLNATTWSYYIHYIQCCKHVSTYYVASCTNIILTYIVQIYSEDHRWWGFSSHAYSCNNITTTLIQISRLFYFGFFSKTSHPIVSRSKSKWYKAQKVQKCALNSQIQALQILTNDDEVENWSLSNFLLAAQFVIWILYNYL